MSRSTEETRRINVEETSKRERAAEALSALAQIARNLSVSLAKDFEKIDEMVGMGNGVLETLDREVSSRLDEKMKIVRDYQEFMENRRSS